MTRAARPPTHVNFVQMRAPHSSCRSVFPTGRATLKPHIRLPWQQRSQAHGSRPSCKRGGSAVPVDHLRVHPHVLAQRLYEGSGSVSKLSTSALQGKRCDCLRNVPLQGVFDIHCMCVVPRCTRPTTFLQQNLSLQWLHKSILRKNTAHKHYPRCPRWSHLHNRGAGL